MVVLCTPELPAGDFHNGRQLGMMLFTQQAC